MVGKSDAERYLERASQLERIAREVFRAEPRRQLMEVAAEWRRMAESAGRLESGAVLKPDHSEERTSS